MHYALENALFQWQDGQRRLRDADDAVRRRLERASDEVVDELRRRLGGTFTLAELASFYATGTDWAETIAAARAGWDASVAVDAAFARYAREARDWGGGRNQALK